MTRSTALGMLRVGNTGEEILSILDVIVADTEHDEDYQRDCRSVVRLISRTNNL